MNDPQTTLPRDVRERLPKAPLLQFEWSPAFFPGRALMQRNRLANCVRWRVGSLVFTHRAPWLPHAARANHPHLFKEAGR